MSSVRRRTLVAGAAMVAMAGFAPVVAPPATAVGVPTVVKVRAAHHPGFDRVVFDLAGGLPAQRSIRYVDRVLADPSGLPVWVPGHAILSLRMQWADAHSDLGRLTIPRRTTLALPNATQVVVTGDFEGVLNIAVGLQRRTAYRLFTLPSPPRVVLDVTTPFRWVYVRDYFVYQPAFVAGTEPYTRPRLRPVIPPAVARGALERLFAGPTPAELAAGFRFVRSDASSFTNLSIVNGVARVQLTGRCSSHGSTLTIASELFPTLKQFPTVRWVKVYDPSGHTEAPTGYVDSIPVCLEP